MTPSLTAEQAKATVKESGNRKNVKNAIKLVSSSDISGVSFSSILGSGTGTGTVTKNNKSKEKHWLVALLE